jgi:hypothetical protein
MKETGILQQDLAAIEIAGGKAIPTILRAGVSYTVEIGKFEWLGREGIYAEISLRDVPDRRFRVRQHQLLKAAGPQRRRNGH